MTIKANGSNGSGGPDDLADSQELETQETAIERAPVSPPPDYGPDAYRNSVLMPGGDQAGRSSYYDYVTMIKWMVEREVRTLGQYVQSGWYRTDWRRKSLVTRYYKLAQWQITSEAGRLNHDRKKLLQERTAIHSLLGAVDLPVERKPGIDPRDYTFSFDGTDYEGVLMLPLTGADAYSRLDWISVEIGRLTATITKAIRQKYYFDCEPLIDWFKTPAAERGEIDLMAISPFFLHRLQVYVDVSIADIWRLQAQRIVAQQSPEDDGDVTATEDRPEKRRGLFSAIKGVGRGR